jgi:hypothetical protein
MKGIVPETSRKQLRKASRLSNDELVGELWTEVCDTKHTVALLHEVRFRLAGACAARDKSDPRNDFSFVFESEH